MIPKEFLATYECEECGEEYEMVNCLVPYFTMHCEECGERTSFVARRMLHRSWEWDGHED